MNTANTGALIARSRKEKGWTQGELAQHLHVSTQAVSKWERGANFPDITLLEDIARHLDLSVSELIAGEKNAPPADEVVREGLRVSLSQLGRRARRWCGLFLCAAALLAIVAGRAGYEYLRDETQLLPQPRTTVDSMGGSSRTSEDLQLAGEVAQTAGSTGAAVYQVSLREGFEGEYSFQMELWTAQGLQKVWPIPHAIGYGYGSMEEVPRHHRLILTYDCRSSAQQLGYGLSFLGPGRTGVVEDFPLPLTQAVSVRFLPGRYEVDPEHGAVLLQLGLGRQTPEGDTQFAYPFYDHTGTGTGAAPRVHEGEALLLLRFLCP